MDSERFGDRLRRLREKSKLSVGELSQAVRVSEGAIRQMESGQTKSASLKVGLRLAEQLSISPWYLAGEKEPADMVIKTADAEFTAVLNATRGDQSAINQAEAAILNALRTNDRFVVSWTRRAPVRQDPNAALDDAETVILPRAAWSQIEETLREVQAKLARLEASQGDQSSPRRRSKVAKSE